MAKSEELPLAVVIVSWNVRDHLDRCLTSLRKALDADDVGAVVRVVDNASHDESAALVAAKHPWVQLDAQSENLGYVRANNLALDALTDQATYIWLLNPDTLIPAGAIGSMLDFLDTHPDVGLIGPKLLNADGSLQECAFRFPGLTQALYSMEMMPTRFYYTGLNGRYPRSTWTQAPPFEIDHPLGAAMMARAAAIVDVGQLDEGFFMYCEEIDWAWRMRKAGWHTYLVPSAEITHLGGASSRQDRPATTAYLWESRARLYKKHQDRITTGTVRFFVQRFFARRLKTAQSEAWATAYKSILAAWN